MVSIYRESCAVNSKTGMEEVYHPHAGLKLDFCRYFLLLFFRIRHFALRRRLFPPLLFSPCNIRIQGMPGA
jgi:hypothetical protein